MSEGPYNCNECGDTLIGDEIGKPLCFRCELMQEEQDLDELYPDSAIVENVID